MSISKLIVFLLPFAACAAQESGSESVRAPDSDLHAPFDRLLRTHVRDQQVDYLSWRDNDAAALKAYLDRLAKVEPAALPRDDRLAFYINAYNATMIDVILQRVSADYSTSNDGWGVFDEALVRLASGEVSLNHLEHEIVRKQFGDPRIHVALVCGARSCPPLLPRAYRGHDIDQVLEENMRRFVRDPRRNRTEGDELELSKLFEWYVEDFGGAEAVATYVARYAGDPGIATRPVGFMDYSWDLNLATPAEGKWVQLVEATVDLEVGAICQVLEDRGDELRVRLPFGRDEATISASAAAPR